MADPFSWTDVGTSIAAIGALGTAAFGVVESVGKIIVFTVGSADRLHFFGLPYRGFRQVKKMLAPLRPALKCAYGPDYLEIIAQQYYADRSAGTAPDLIRQGVRLGLPFVQTAAATTMISKIWHLGDVASGQLAVALQSASNAVPASDPPASPSPDTISQAQALVGRFASALDARIEAAFDIADQKYETTAKTLAGVVAIALALGFDYSLSPKILTPAYPWYAAFAVGLIAVPLAPVAKDLSSYLQNAFTAFKTLSGKS